MEKKELKTGTLVQSRAGRDEGKYFMVAGVLSADFVLIADGRYRKLNNLKKKRVKHLRHMGAELTAIAEKLREEKKVFDSELWSAISKSVASINGAGAEAKEEAETDNQSGQ